ncbi:MAG: YceI family protein [Hyphomonas sp.]
MRYSLISASVLVLAACGAPTATDAAPETPAAAPVAAEATAGPDAPAPVDVKYPKAGTYQSDPTHTSVTWTVKHLGLSDYTSRFDVTDAKLVLNPDDVALSTLNVTIDPNSIDPYYPADYKAALPDSGFDSWQDDLAHSERWFNANAFPKITYVSTGVEKTGPDTATVIGDLTLLGVTRPITLDVKYNGVMNFPNAPDVDRIGFSATATLKRSDFGMSAVSAFVGDDVNIMIETELTEVTE